jgi:hypothetical protein
MSHPIHASSIVTHQQIKSRVTMHPSKTNENGLLRRVAIPIICCEKGYICREFQIENRLLYIYMSTKTRAFSIRSELMAS